MKKRYRLFFVGAVFVMAAMLLFAGCGDSEDPTNTPGGNGGGDVVYGGGLPELHAEWFETQYEADITEAGTGHAPVDLRPDGYVVQYGYFDGWMYSATNSTITVYRNGVSEGGASYSISGTELTIFGVSGGFPVPTGVYYKRDDIIKEIVELSISSNGSYNSQTTTEVYLSFDRDISGLTANDITLSGQSSIIKGDLVHNGYGSYTLPISGVTFDENIIISVSKSGYSINYRDNFAHTYYYPVSEGIYVGIIKFAGTSEDLTGGEPVLLDFSGRSTLTTALNQYVLAQQNGTALFYGVHHALANIRLNENGFPSNLDSVNILTFTDGLDNASSFQSISRPLEDKVFNNSAEYSVYVKGEIESRETAGKPVTAYSVGVRGNDVTDIAGFQTALANIASPGKSQELTDFNDLQATFDTIANGLNITHTNTDFNLVTAGLDPGVVVRMTFDVGSTDADAAAASSRYIEGTIDRIVSEGQMRYTLTNIVYSDGISSGAGSGPISGTINGTEVSFVFNGITGYSRDEDEANTRQFLKNSGATTWQHNNEYNSAGSSETTVEKRSAIIYLVLDCSTSLDAARITSIRDAALSFINSLYNQYNGDN